MAFEVTPVAEEYRIEAGPEPVLVVADSNGPLDDSLARRARRRRRGGGRPHAPRGARRASAPTPRAALNLGMIARTACLAFATENTHGFEIAHLDGIAACVDVLERWLPGDDAGRAGLTCAPRRSSSAG